MRITCTCDTEALEPHVYTLSDDVDAEAAIALELAPDARTKMVLVRCLQRANDLAEDETLERAWASNLLRLQDRAARHLPDPPAAPAPAGGRGRGGGGGADEAKAEAEGEGLGRGRRG